MEFSLFEILIGIVGVFFILLLVKEFVKKNLKKEFCVICLSVSLVWMGLLVLNFLDLFENKVLIGLLMGHTSLGLFYLFEEKVKKKYKVFRLPLLLTLITGFYTVLVGVDTLAYLFVAALWIMFILVYLFQNNEKVNVFVNKLVECCREI